MSIYHRFAKYILNNDIIAAILFVAFFAFLFVIKDILIALFISYIIMASLAPFADYLVGLKIPRGLAVFLSYLLVLLLFVGIIVPLVPIFTTQVEALYKTFPYYLDRVARTFGIHVGLSELQSFFASEFNTIGQNAFIFTQKVFGGILSVVTILVVSFYMLVDHVRIKSMISSFFPTTERQGIVSLLRQVDEKLGAWLRGQVVLSLFIGALTWICLTAINLPFALPLAILAGFLEIIPTLGPLISAIPAVIVAFTISPSMAAFVALVYFGIQLLENNLLVPRIMEKAVGLHPLVIIFGIITGGNLLGILGALLSIPFISMCQVIYNHIRNS